MSTNEKIVLALPKGRILREVMEKKKVFCSPPMCVNAIQIDINFLSHSDTKTIEDLRKLENVFIYKGWVPDKFKVIKDKLFIFVHSLY